MLIHLGVIGFAESYITVGNIITKNVILKLYWLEYAYFLFG